jgi:hypothetical protein
MSVSKTMLVNNILGFNKSISVKDIVDNHNELYPLITQKYLPEEGVIQKFWKNDSIQEEMFRIYFDVQSLPLEITLDDSLLVSNGSTTSLASVEWKKVASVTLGDRVYWLNSEKKVEFATIIKILSYKDYSYDLSLRNTRGFYINNIYKLGKGN